jgi:hypothetical protein
MTDGVPQQVEGDWTTWSDPELLGRLLRRGVEGVTAKGWVRDRMTAEVIEEIETVLTSNYSDEDGKEVRLEMPLDRRARR